MTSKNIVAIILARGGSKGVPKKNLMEFCGIPLIAWSIKHALNVSSISSIWVSSDSKEILDVAKKFGANTISRPKELADDFSNADDGYLHAIEEIRKNGTSIDIVIALQCTSPIREAKDVSSALEKFEREKYDSMFSASPISDFFIWEEKNGEYNSINYDYKNRGRRQEFPTQYAENGSFYIFKPEILQKYHNRLGGKIGLAEMEFWKVFEIDTAEDIKLCKIIMQNYLL